MIDESTLAIQSITTALSSAQINVSETIVGICNYRTFYDRAVIAIRVRYENLFAGNECRLSRFGFIDEDDPPSLRVHQTFPKSGNSIHPENARFPACGFSRSPASYLLPRPRDPIGRSRRFDRLRPNLPTWKFKAVCAST